MFVSEKVMNVRILTLWLSFMQEEIEMQQYGHDNPQFSKY